MRVVIGNGAAHLEFVLPNAFIFADDFGVYQHPPDGYYEVVVDGGLLLAELALIISLSGILVLIPTFLSQAKEAIYDANHSPEQPATVAFWSALRFTAGIGCCSPHYRLGALA